MGCGKSSVGRRLSQLLCCPFMDLDEMIEQVAGKTIPEIFDNEGEAGFRALEKTVLTSFLSEKEEGGKDRATRGTKAGGPQAKRSGGVSAANVLTLSSFSDRKEGTREEISENQIAVMSLGGGTVMTRECAEILHDETLCIYLRATVETLTNHLKGETANRPMLSGNLESRITELMAIRSSAYESTAHIIIDIDGQTVEETADAIISLL